MASNGLVVTCFALTASTVAGLVLILRRRGTHGSKRHPGLPAIIPKGSPLATINPNQFSIVSYNVLADVFVGSLTYAAPEVVQWSYRWPLIEKVLSSCCADIICLQEVDAIRQVTQV
jgi:hypothetical protein